MLDRKRVGDGAYLRAKPEPPKEPCPDGDTLRGNQFPEGKPVERVAGQRDRVLQQVLEADGEARELGDALHGEQYARHERRAVDRVVTDGEGLPLRAEHDLL
jgi:hypothetical protein